MKGSKRIAVALVVLLGAAGLAGLWVHRQLSLSLPVLEGEVPLAGLDASVVVERDASGVPTLSGRSRADVARALGFLHAQERFFQMDLTRRRASGELAALVGESAAPLDRFHRLHRMRARAERVVEAASPEEHRLLTAYVDGVNAGLGALDAAPFEYLLLREEPAPWRAEDSVLVVLSMFFQLNDATGAREAALELLYDTLPEPLADFLTPAGTEWDAPVVGPAFATPPVPEAGVVDLRGERPAATLGLDEGMAASAGSNSWAVAGRRSAHGGALLANDMHLGHAVPNIWYRAVMTWGDERIIGVTLPGTPMMVVGSNGHIAWGFTNSYGDWVDLVELELDPSGGSRYRTPGGWREIVEHRETIEIRGGEAETLVVRESIWGPLVEESRSVRWVAHEPGGVDLELAALETARSVEEALAVAARSGIPPQNFLCVDREGAIAWTIAGRIPRRLGFDGRRPTSWADGDRRWDGFVSPEDAPRIVDPPEGILWTANARVVSGEMLDVLGDGGYAFGARARQIRDALRELDSATEQKLLEIQLDDRALFLTRWRELFLELTEGREELAGLRRVLDDGWTGRASIDSAGYRAVRDLRTAVHEEALSPLIAPAVEADGRMSARALRQSEGPLWRLVSERPPHLVPPPHESWEEALVDIVARRVSSWSEPASERTWGARNTSAIRHPLSRAAPFLSRWLDMPPRPLPGDRDMPRVQGPSHGASERLVVSPGREEEGLFHMPGGQSGHPLSPYYGLGQEDWEAGRPTPLLPGETRYRMTLIPGGRE